MLFSTPTGRHVSDPKLPAARLGQRAYLLAGPPGWITYIAVGCPPAGRIGDLLSSLPRAPERCDNDGSVQSRSSGVSRSTAAAIRLVGQSVGRSDRSVHPSVDQSVSWQVGSVGPSVGRSVGRSVSQLVGRVSWVVQSIGRSGRSVRRSVELAISRSAGR